MGLFFKKKKTQETSSAKTEKETNSTQTGGPQQFYNDCVIDFHKTAEELGYAKRGLIAIPELGPIGQKTVLTFLNDKFFQMQFGSNPKTYYYVITSLCMQAGIVFAKKWHENYAELKNGYVEEIMEDGPADAAYEILKKDFGMDKNAFGQYSQKIFERWLAMHEPYWKLQDPRDYTFSALNAVYQLGVSMTLEKYGY